MILSINIKSVVPLDGLQIFDILQTLTIDDCDQIARMKVDQLLWFNEVLEAFRPE